eukprot:2755334-Rhodomonas_salina.4
MPDGDMEESRRYKPPPKVLRVCYEISGTDLGYAATRTVDGISHIAKWRELGTSAPIILRTSYAVSSADVAMLLPVEVLGSEQAFPIIKWAALKGPERAIEKLVRSYGGKVWRLLDVCRQNIIFRSGTAPRVVNSTGKKKRKKEREKRNKGEKGQAIAVAVQCAPGLGSLLSC